MAIANGHRIHEGPESGGVDRCFSFCWARKLGGETMAEDEDDEDALFIVTCNGKLFGLVKG